MDEFYFFSGQFEYELVLKTDLYTRRHTQWYYFRLRNTLPGITYKFRIINLLKKDSLYNHGKSLLWRHMNTMAYQSNDNSNVFSTALSG